MSTEYLPKFFSAEIPRNGKKLKNVKNVMIKYMCDLSKRYEDLHLGKCR